MLLILSITPVMLVVLTIRGHRHVPFPTSTKDITTKRPTWLYRGFTSYEQLEWLRNTPSDLVKRISCLVSQSWSVGRCAAMILPEKNLLTLKRPYAETCLYPSPQRCYAKRIQPGKGQHCCVAALLTTGKVAYHALNVSSQVAWNPLGDHFRTQKWFLKWNLPGGS